MASILDKYSQFENLSPDAPIEIELGCGEQKRHANAIGIDIRDCPSVDVVGDVFDVLQAIPDKAVSAVYSYHFIEHLENTERLMDDLARVVKPNGNLLFVVPHFSNPFFYSDPTHKATFGLYSFSYFCNDTVFVRRVPQYGRPAEFSLIDARLGFKSYRPRYLRHGLKRAIESLVNVSSYSKEFYEENLSGLLPCYEIAFRLRRH